LEILQYIVIGYALGLIVMYFSRVRSLKAKLDCSISVSRSFLSKVFSIANNKGLEAEDVIYRFFSLGFLVVSVEGSNEELVLKREDGSEFSIEL